MSDDRPLGRVMLIDDEPFDQMLYKRVIKRTGLATDIIGFTLATNAIAYLRDGSQPKIDLILLDIRMPMMDGFEFLEEAQNDLGTEDAPPIVMMLTTSLSPADRARSEGNKVVRRFLNKPLTAEQVEDFVDLVAATRTG